MPWSRAVMDFAANKGRMPRYLIVIVGLVATLAPALATAQQTTTQACAAANSAANPFTAVENCDQAVSNASWAPWTVPRAKAYCASQQPELSQGPKQLQAEARKCWALDEKALSRLSQAERYYQESARSPAPRGPQLDLKAQRIHRQANQLIDRSRQCVSTALRQADVLLGKYCLGGARGLRKLANLTYEMRMLTEAMLRFAGRISKSMTDAMDVTKHNNVGIGIALGSYLGAIGKLAEGISQAANGLKLAAAANTTAGQQQALMEIASIAEQESAAAANNAEQVLGSALKQHGPPPATTGPLEAPQGYLSDIQYINQTGEGQGSMPICGVLTCRRLANILGQDIEYIDAFTHLQPNYVSRYVPTIVDGKPLIVNGQVVRHLEITGGLTPQKMVDGLRAMGLQAATGSGVDNLMAWLSAGRPLIAGVKTVSHLEAASELTQIPLHAVVVEGVESRAGVLGLTIYDPVGFSYWQPLSTFRRFFTGEFIYAH